MADQPIPAGDPVTAHQMHNPLMQLQLGLTEDGNKPCLIVTYLGEAGDKVAIVHMDHEYFDTAIKMMKWGSETWKIAEGDTEKAVQMFEERSSVLPSAPDDISSLDDEKGQM
jgi:hypothetical protein